LDSWYVFVSVNYRMDHFFLFYLRERERKRESAAVKRRVQEKDSIESLLQLKKLEKQGQMIVSVDGNEIEVWANTIQITCSTSLL